MKRQQGSKVFFVISVMICSMVITCKNVEAETRDSIKYEKIIQSKLGHEYQIIKKKLIHMPENVPVYLADYRQAKRDQKFSLSPYFVYEEKNLKLIACAVVNVHDRENKSAAVVIMKVNDTGDLEITQVIEKQVWDLFPVIIFSKSNKIIMFLEYQAGTDWSDAYQFDRKTGQFVDLPSEM